MNIPNIDFFHKLITFLGLTIIIISAHFVSIKYNSITKEKIDYSEQLLQLENSYDYVIKELQKFSDNVKQSVEKLEELNEKSKEMGSKEFDEESRNILEKYKLDKVKYETKITVAVEKRDSITAATKMNEELLKVKVDLYKEEFRFALIYLILGVTIFLYGLDKWNRKEQFEKRLIYRQNLDKPEFSNECQSCGKKFDSITVYGSELNGDKNFHFCKKCYSNSDFSEPDLTYDEYKNHVISELKAQNLKEKEIKAILKIIEGLDRWKRNRYV